MDNNKYFWIEYNFKFLESKRKDLTFTVLLDKETIIAVPPEQSKSQKWTKLDFCKCNICPLGSEVNENCPIAFNLSGLAAAFSDVSSIEKVDITVSTPDRKYIKTDTVQQGLRSIYGIYMAASGCPHMEILRPMVRFHLPFASMEDSVFRHVSSYLMGEYFNYIEGKKSDFHLLDLAEKTTKVNTVNHGICNRLDTVVENDANKNALTILNITGVIVNMELEARLNSIRHIF